MKLAAILDTSWLLELYRVPRHCQKSRQARVRKETGDVIETGGELFATVPMLFEVAGHITRVKSGTTRRDLGERLRDDVKGSLDFDREGPWTIAAHDRNILFRSKDVIELADRFLETSGANYSFADISIIDLATQLRKRDRIVRILTFDKQLRAYSVYPQA